MAGRPRKTTDGLTITGEEDQEATPEVQQDTEEETTEKPDDTGDGTGYRAFLKGVVVQDSPYGVSDGLVTTQARVTHNGKEIYKDTFLDRELAVEKAREAVLRHKILNNDAEEEEIEL